MYIIGVEDELWDIIEDGINFEVNEEGIVADRRNLIVTQKNMLCLMLSI